MFVCESGVGTLHRTRLNSKGMRAEGLRKRSQCWKVGDRHEKQTRSKERYRVSCLNLEERSEHLRWTYLVQMQYGTNLTFQATLNRKRQGQG